MLRKRGIKQQDRLPAIFTRDFSRQLGGKFMSAGGKRARGARKPMTSKVMPSDAMDAAKNWLKKQFKKGYQTIRL